MNAGDVRALTLYPEHAEAFRLGLRTIETRSKPTTWRGRLLLHAGARDPDCAAARRSPHSQAALAAITHGDPLTRGAVVASCVLTNCVEIVGWAEDPPCDHLTVNGDVLNAWAYVPDGERRAWQALDPSTRASNGGPNVDDRSDQLPFGDFTPGRYAWLLGDVKPTSERCPRCWRECSRPSRPGWCDTCRGSGVCEPVPMKGRQGLWVPTW